MARIPFSLLVDPPVVGISESCVAVFAFTSFSENSTSDLDLEIKVTEL